MARDFVAANSQYVQVDSSPVSGYPLTVAAWAKVDDTSERTILWIGDKDVANQQLVTLRMVASFGNVLIRMVSQSAAGSTTLDTSTTTMTGTWAHATGVIASSADRRVFLNGGGKGTSVASVSPSGEDRLAIGRQAGSTPARYMEGNLAEAAIWNVDLSDAEVALLAKAVSPLMVRPESLVFYAPLIGRYSPEIDIIGGLNLTVTGATDSAHPRIFIPRQPLYMFSVGEGSPPPLEVASSSGYVVNPAMLYEVVE